ncbi:MAG: class I SAM-dependent methyltransferase, partial [Pseudomonadota bacterium]
MRDWEELAAPWLKHEARMEAAHGPVLEALLAQAGLQQGQAVLDIGMGSGRSTALIAQTVGPDVTAIDIAPPFVARTAERGPAEVTLLAEDAQTYPFAQARFDAAISMLGTMFFADTGAAFSNIARALKPGAVFSFSAWAPPPTNPWLSTAARITAEVMGPPETPPDPSDAGPFRFSDPAVPMAALDKALWQAEFETRNFTLTPTGTPAEIAATQLELGVAARRITEEAASPEKRAGIPPPLNAPGESKQSTQSAGRVAAG